jgi:hypothetical protein
MPVHDDIVRIFHGVQSPFAVKWKPNDSSAGLSGRDTPLDGLTVIRDHDRTCLYGRYDLFLLVPEYQSNTGGLVNKPSEGRSVHVLEALFLAVMTRITNDTERDDSGPVTELKVFAAREVDGAEIVRQTLWIRLGFAFCFSGVTCSTTESLNGRVR